MSSSCKYGHNSGRYAKGDCIVCAKERSKKYYVDNKDAIAEQKKDYNKRTRDRVIERNKAWALKNPEKHKAMRKAIDARSRRGPKRQQWVNENAQKLTAYLRSYYESNKDRLAAQNAAWKRANKDKVTAYCQARRARELGAEGRFTADDIARLFEAQNGLCVYCHVSLTKYAVDHIFPLVRGGSNFPSNLQLLCRSCNSRKADQPPEVFAARLAA